MFKKCTECKKNYPLSSFTKGNDKDHKTYRCKNCAKRYRKNHSFRARENRRKYFLKNREKERLYRKNYYQEHREEALLKVKRFQIDEPEKYKARNSANYAKKIGKLQPKPCSVCGNLEINMHHNNYSEPLKVVWLCRKHHKRLHIKMSIQEEEKKVDAPEEGAEENKEDNADE